MKIQLVPVDGLTRYARNARTHSPEQLGQIKASMLEFGWTNPILADMSAGGSIVAGHGRLSSAQELFKSGVAIKLPSGETLPAGMVPVIDCAGWTDAQRRAYVLVDNKTAINAGWDEEMLRLELAALEDDGFDLSLTGFGQDELDGLFFDEADEGGGNTDPDDVPDIQDDPVSRIGDVWILGRHRLVCGDSTDPLIVDLALNGEKPNLMITDPPYGVQYDAGWRERAGINRGGGDAKGKVLNDDRSDWREAWALFPGCAAYIWHAGIYTYDVISSLFANDFELRAQIIWVKNNLVFGRGHYHWQHEPCLYAVRKGGSSGWVGDRKQTTTWRFVNDLLEPGENVFLNREDAESLWALSGNESTVWEIPKPQKSETGHSTQKPVECMRRPMINNSKRGDRVYEPFSGSGTSLIAAEQSGRICHAIELNPLYVDVGVRRWEAFTGGKAVLESTGAHFGS